jgi:hypothetical protein
MYGEVVWLRCLCDATGEPNSGAVLCNVDECIREVLIWVVSKMILNAVWLEGI